MTIINNYLYIPLTSSVVVISLNARTMHGVRVWCVGGEGGRWDAGLLKYTHDGVCAVGATARPSDPLRGGKGEATGQSAQLLLLWLLLNIASACVRIEYAV